MTVNPLDDTLSWQGVGLLFGVLFLVTISLCSTVHKSTNPSTKLIFPFYLMIAEA